jgi:DNA-binding MarR family transcriptional regulator
MKQLTTGKNLCISKPSVSRVIHWPGARDRCRLRSLNYDLIPGKSACFSYGTLPFPFASPSLFTKVEIEMGEYTNDFLSPFIASRSTTRSVTKLYDLVLAPTGLKATQFITLKAIHEAAEISQHEFARKYFVAIETLSRHFAALRGKGLVTSRRGGKHEQIYFLTDKGIEALQQALPYWQRAQARLRTILGNNDWESLLLVCDLVALAAEKAERLLRSNRALQLIQGKQAPSEHNVQVASTK